jgi:hypothetical protein
VNTYSHHFLEQFNGFIGYGFDRQSNEDTLQIYLQKFSDDALMATVLKRMADVDLDAAFEMITNLLRKYLTDEEYHALFLKDD